MKNKKILSRILALCSVVVLLFALALPCFADETEPPFTNAELWDLFAQADDHNYNNSAYTLFSENHFNDIDIYMIGNLYLFSMYPSYIGEFWKYDVFSLLLDDNFRSDNEINIYYAYGLVTLTMDGSYAPDLVYDIEYLRFTYQGGNGAGILGYNFDGDMVLNITYSYNDGVYEFTEIELGDGRYYHSARDDFNNDKLDFAFLVYEHSNVMSEDLYRALSDDSFSALNPRGFALGVNSGYAANRTDGVVPPAKTGLFGQLYYILSDAIYGENVTLGSTQDFALTLVTTLLVLCVVLLPVLLVVAIMFKLFRW